MKNTIIHFWERYRGYIIPLSLVLCALVLFPHVVHAADPPASGSTVSLPSSPDADSLYRDIARFLTFVMGFLQRLIWPVLLLIGGLMKNDILFGAGMEDRMLEIWANVRNIVNILFVLLLLGIAFYNVVGGKNQAFHLKEALPKFVIGLIAVNFSFLGVKVIVDTVNIVSTAIFAMPDAVQEGLGKNDISNIDFQKKICEGIYGKDLSKSKVLIKKDPQNALCKEDLTLVDKAKDFFARYDGSNAAVVMAINLGKITEYDKVDLTIQDIKNLATQTIFSVGLYMAYATAFIALFVILLVRMIVLWVTIVLSPFMVFAYVLPENLKSSLGGAGEMQKKFVQTAIIPIPIAIMMTIGFMMLKGLQTSNMGSLTLSTATLGAGFLTSGLSTFQEVIIAAGTIGVIWIGVFEASKGTYADSIVEKIKGGVEGAGKFALSAIQYAPIFPVAVPGEKGGTQIENMSLATGLGIAEQLPQAMKSAEAQKSHKIVEKIMKRNLFEAQRQAREAKSAEELIQAGANAGTRAGSDKDLQRTFGDKLGQNASWHAKLNFDGLVDKDNKPLDKQKFIDMLKKGEAPDEAVNHFIQTNRDKMGITPQTPKEKPGEAGKGAGTEPAINKTDAAAIAGAGGTGTAYMGALSKPEKDAVEAYNKAQAGKDEKKKDETLVAAQGALSKLKGLADGGIDHDAAMAKTSGDLDALIIKRREALTKSGMSEGDANKAIANEMKLTLDDTSKTEITSGTEGTKIRAATVAPAPAAPATPAKPKAATGKPAATAKPAHGSQAAPIPVTKQNAAAAGVNPDVGGAQKGSDGLYYTVTP